MKHVFLIPFNWWKTSRLIFMTHATWSSTSVLSQLGVSRCPSAAGGMTSLAFISMRKTILKVSCREVLRNKNDSCHLSSLPERVERCTCYKNVLGCALCSKTWMSNVIISFLKAKQEVLIKTFLIKKRHADQSGAKGEANAWIEWNWVISEYDNGK